MQAQKKVIGIISYLPDNKEVRNFRWKKLIALISKCEALFDLPIYIESQNWTDDEITKVISKDYNIKVHYNEKPLGIVGARRALRSWFIKSDFDYLIMLDDDITIYGSNGKKYLAQIDENPNCFIENCASRLQLFAISKEVFKQVDYEDATPENGDGFEDRIFVAKLRKQFPDKRKTFKDTDLFEDGIATNDKNSTWWNGHDPKVMLAKTEKIIEKL